MLERKMHKKTPRWVVKEKEESTTINIVNKQFTPLQLVTQNMIWVQTQSNNFEEVQAESNHEDSPVQSTGGNSSPRWFVVYMVSCIGDIDNSN